jgi:hypothetical protein
MRRPGRLADTADFCWQEFKGDDGGMTGGDNELVDRHF